MTTAAAPRPTPARIAAAWSVHLLTALGGVAGTAALVALHERELRGAAVLMLAALAIDCVDGSLARAARVSEVLPWFDGRRLDDIVDFLNYVVVPAVFLVVAGSLTHALFAALPVLASSYGFCQEQAKTDDDFFLGFPSYWNVVALYAWLFGTPPVFATLLVVVLAILVFVPLKYLYPSKMKVFWWTTNVGGALWIVAITLVVLAPERTAPFRLLELSLLYPAYYIAGSLWLGGLSRSRA